MTEIWKDIPGYEGYYMVSTLGRVKGLERLIVSKKLTRLQPAIMMKTTLVNGYPCLDLSKHGNAIKFTVHGLMGRAFLNHNPKQTDLVMDHIDNNRANNRLENLQIITHRQNCTKDQKGYSSKYIGVYWNKKDKKWMSKISLNGKNCHLGTFNNEIDASNAYQEKLREYEFKNN